MSLSALGRLLATFRREDQREPLESVGTLSSAVGASVATVVTDGYDDEEDDDDFFLTDEQRSGRRNRRRRASSPDASPRIVQKVDSQGRLHCEDGPAVWNEGQPPVDNLGELSQVFTFGASVEVARPALSARLARRRAVHSWWLHGVAVPRWVVLEPDTITVWVIDREVNSEVRRIMIDRYQGEDPGDGLNGVARYMRDCGAEEIHRDKYGVLYRREMAGDEPILMVKVLNSTPEKDGSVKTYWLRVPPDTRTAKQGVASTFGMKSSEWKPEKET